MTGPAVNTAAKRTPAKGLDASSNDGVFDRELEDLPQELRWREWMGRIEAVLFASASPVGRQDLARVVGQGASVEMLIEDIQAELTGRPYELTEVAGGWMFRTRTQFAEAIKAAVDLGAKRAVAMHYGTFDLSDEPLDEPPRRFREAAEKSALGVEAAWMLDIGETRKF